MDWVRSGFFGFLRIFQRIDPGKRENNGFCGTVGFFGGYFSSDVSFELSLSELDLH